MNNIFIQNSLTAIVFKLQVNLLIMEGTEKSELAITHLVIGIDFQVTHHVVAIENSIRDARTLQPGEIVFNTMRYRSIETVQRSGYF